MSARRRAEPRRAPEARDDERFDRAPARDALPGAWRYDVVATARSPRRADDEDEDLDGVAPERVDAPRVDVPRAAVLRVDDERDDAPRPDEERGAGFFAPEPRDVERPRGVPPPRRRSSADATRFPLLQT
ncbi:hypothetical protein [Isoptericola variabilis]|uniref:Uncharacterized protein n=1 Tax=Isoptericola variabilis (strain 225) TaxID=743718 RepID=F6FUS3_ISOV2|nr:hypothetical protein [Isoptericola variabilis]AEG43334.1 hypothetical protein Isova_0539 [Isoptericola variabilis 225]TWH35271.1 hypothetical protein L600_000100002750 [Isoptericola variabilis J7]